MPFQLLLVLLLFISSCYGNLLDFRSVIGEDQLPGQMWARCFPLGQVVNLVKPRWIEETAENLQQRQDGDHHQHTAGTGSVFLCGKSVVTAAVCAALAPASWGRAACGHSLILTFLSKGLFLYRPYKCRFSMLDMPVKQERSGACKR